MGRADEGKNRQRCQGTGEGGWEAAPGASAGGRDGTKKKRFRGPRKWVQKMAPPGGRLCLRVICRWGRKVAPLFGTGKPKKIDPGGEKKWPRCPGREGRRDYGNGASAGGATGGTERQKTGKTMTGLWQLGDCLHVRRSCPGLRMRHKSPMFGVRCATEGAGLCRI